jgi:hypothetical protein
VDTLLTCTACGNTGYDVRTRIVEAPEGSTVRVGTDLIPERFRSEPRCIDRDACDERRPLVETA